MAPHWVLARPILVHVFRQLQIVLLSGFLLQCFHPKQCAIAVIPPILVSVLFSTRATNLSQETSGFLNPRIRRLQKRPVFSKSISNTCG